MCDCVCIWFSQEDHVKNREFLVVLIATNYSVCHSSRETIPFVSINSTCEPKNYCLGWKAKGG